jgi:hypothetical protein
MLQDAAVHERHADAEHRRELRVVAAGVDRTCLRIVIGMFPDQQGIELTQHGDGRPGPGAAFEHSLHTRERQTPLDWSTKLLEFISY